MSSNSTGLDASFDFQESFFVGVNLQAVLYGLDLCVYFKTMQILLCRRKTISKDDVFYAVFSTVMLVLATFIYAINASSGQSVWLVDQTHPSKPISYAFVEVVGVMSLVLQLMAYGFMASLTYRCHVVWDSLHAIIIPSVFWLAVVALGIVSIWASSAARTSLFGGLAGQLNLAYYSVSVILSTKLTCMICYRLGRYSRMMKKQLGPDHAAPHFTIGMFVVESSLPLGVAGIAFLAAYWFRSPAEAALLLVYSMMMCLSPQMLILRMVEGNAWQKETTRSLRSAVTFECNSRDAPAQDNPDRTGTVIRLESLPEETPSTWESGKEDKV
ncbi:hypothetical protein EV363DRAFT_1554231 [Boletus edulis]|uniref:Uncharacterized protein n=1 Tax=Boletus edulis BED1 TaxID=1328754 RepID=A0AAD4BFA0_BOLED|nr:hypothetical protein EV363DRAFT_1554231 [Boletus edulis]KAF8425732.1 hypothetical protein L210DRAFT_3421163 [Boletus edulis BED1]